MPEMPVRLIWSLSSSGIGTTIAASGNSGAYQTTGPPPWTPDYLSAIDLRYVEDILLTVIATAIVSAPTLTVTLNAFDDLGNTFKIASAAAVTAAGGAANGATTLSIGKHGGSATSYVVFPSWAQIAWTCTGGSTTGTEISLWGR